MGSPVRLAGEDLSLYLAEKPGPREGVVICPSEAHRAERMGMTSAPPPGCLAASPSSSLPMYDAQVPLSTLLFAALYLEGSKIS